MLKLKVFGLTAGAITAVAIVGGASAAPFLCPVVGDGVLNADAHNGSNGVAAITPPAGTCLLPGNTSLGG
jgi:hypothetical protein